MTPFDFCGLAVFDKVCLCFVGVLFGLREEVDFERVVLEDVCEDAATFKQPAGKTSYVVGGGAKGEYLSISRR